MPQHAASAVIETRSRPQPRLARLRRLTRPPPPASPNDSFPSKSVPTASEQLLYRPALLGVASLHYALAKAGVDCWEKAAWLAPLDAASAAAPWEGAREIGRAAPDLDAEPVAGARFAELPAAAMRAESYERWRKALAAHLYRTRALVLLAARIPRTTSRPGESEGAFRVRLRDALRESRDAAVEKLRARFAPQLATLRDQKARAEHRIEAEREQYAAKKMDSVISLGASVVGALFGRKLASRANVGRAATAMRGIGRAADERGDVGRAEDRADQIARQARGAGAELSAGDRGTGGARRRSRRDRGTPRRGAQGRPRSRSARAGLDTVARRGGRQRAARVVAAGRVGDASRAFEAELLWIVARGAHSSRNGRVAAT